MSRAPSWTTGSRALPRKGSQPLGTTRSLPSTAVATRTLRAERLRELGQGAVADGDALHGRSHPCSWAQTASIVRSSSYNSREKSRR